MGEPKILSRRNSRGYGTLQQCASNTNFVVITARTECLNSVTKLRGVRRVHTPRGCHHVRARPSKLRQKVPSAMVRELRKCFGNLTLNLPPSLQTFHKVQCYQLYRKGRTLVPYQFITCYYPCLSANTHGSHISHRTSCSGGG
jgi:hypothetical protein